jgi:outer membrane lipoprotein SlyB
MLGDHFWPAMYPGIIVGALVGLSRGNVVSTILGAVGGLLGAMALYFVFTLIGLDESILSLAGLIGGAVVGAYLMMRAGRRLRQA